MKAVLTPVSFIPIRRLLVGMLGVWTNVSPVASVHVLLVVWVVVLTTPMRTMDPGRLERAEAVVMVVPLTVLELVKIFVLGCVFRLAIMGVCNSVQTTAPGIVSPIAALVVWIIVPMIV